MNPQILIDEIKLISERLAALEKRNSPATAEEITAIVEFSKEATSIKVDLDSSKVGERLAQYLPKQTEIEAIRNKILDAGTQAAARIEQAGAKKNAGFVNLLGFSSLKAFLLLSALPIFICAIFLMLWLSTRKEREIAQESARINMVFAEWVKKKHNNVFNEYLESGKNQRDLE